MIVPMPKLHSWMNNMSPHTTLPQMPTDLPPSELQKYQKVSQCDWFSLSSTVVTIITHTFVVFSLRLLRECSVFVAVQRNVIFGAELVQTTDLRGRARKS